MNHLYHPKSKNSHRRRIENECKHLFTNYASSCGLALLLYGCLRCRIWVSGFGTLGGAISDNKITYQRYIDDNGTLMRDSLARRPVRCEI